MNRHSGEAALCKATSSGLEVSVFVAVPAVTALALEDTDYSERSTTVSRSRGLALAFKGLTPWFNMEVPTEVLPKD